MVTALAAAKAGAVAGVLDEDVAADAVVIGCDSMLYVDGRLTGKPGTAEAARRQWHSMAGREGRLFTGHCVIRVRDGAPVATETAAAITTVRFGIPTESELGAYIATGEPLGWPARSRSTVWAAGSSTASTATHQCDRAGTGRDPPAAGVGGLLDRRIVENQSSVGFSRVSACRSEPALQQYAHPERLVTGDWLSVHPRHPGLAIVESDEDVLLYDVGHIPGRSRSTGTPTSTTRTSATTSTASSSPN